MEEKSWTPEDTLVKAEFEEKSTWPLFLFSPPFMTSR